MDEIVKEEQLAATSIPEGHETKCWGCGLHLLLPSYTPIFKCGWCGAITNLNPRKREGRWSYRWICLRDWIFVTTLFLFILFVICGGVWAVYPVVFSISFSRGVFHCIITFILSVCTISTLSLAAFRSAGAPPSMVWGSYPVVGKGGLQDYTFCEFCKKPKCPRTHHCSSCGMCVLDMDHHCPFIGNCVGAANHRHFIAFLICVVISTAYISLMTAYAGFHVWLPLAYQSHHPSNIFSTAAATRAVKKMVLAFLSSALLLSPRGVVLMYLLTASVSLEIGISLLLWQQLRFIYEGRTYISYISSRNSENPEKGWHNLFRFFGCPYSALQFLLGSSSAGKSHEK